MNDARGTEDIDKAAPEPHGPLGRALESVCEVVAMVGGLLLVAIMRVSSVSRWISTPSATAVDRSLTSVTWPRARAKWASAS